MTTDDHKDWIQALSVIAEEAMFETEQELSIPRVRWDLNNALIDAQAYKEPSTFSDADLVTDFIKGGFSYLIQNGNLAGFPTAIRRFTGMARFCAAIEEADLRSVVRIGPPGPVMRDGRMPTKEFMREFWEAVNARRRARERSSGRESS